MIGRNGQSYICFIVLVVILFEVQYYTTPFLYSLSASHLGALVPQRVMAAVMVVDKLAYGGDCRGIWHHISDPMHFKKRTIKKVSGHSSLVFFFVCLFFTTNVFLIACFARYWQKVPLNTAFRVHSHFIIPFTSSSLILSLPIIAAQRTPCWRQRSTWSIIKAFSGLITSAKCLNGASGCSLNQM